MRCSSFHLRADSATIQSSVKGMVWKKHIVQVTNFAYGPAASQPQNSPQLNTITNIATLRYWYTSTPWATALPKFTQCSPAAFAVPLSTMLTHFEP